MNKIVVFTGSRTPLKTFPALEKSKKWELSSVPHSELRKELKTPDIDTLYLLDYASLDEENRLKDLNYLTKKQEAARGVIDRRNDIEDPALLLMAGCDYYGANLLKSGVSPARIGKYLNDRKEGAAAASEAAASGTTRLNHIISGNGWKDISSGSEYSFYMLFTEITIPAAWKKKSGNQHLNSLKKTFQEVVERTVAPCSGKVWIWNEYGGLVLFPYNGETCIPVVSAIRLLINRVLISVEDFDLHTPIKLRASMHLGKTVWKARGKTGTIVSDSLNSIFHLGTKYTPLNDFDITEDVFLELMPGMRKLFRKAGIYENRKIYRLCHFEVSE